MNKRLRWDLVLCYIVVGTTVAVVAALILVKLAAGDTGP